MIDAGWAFAAAMAGFGAGYAYASAQYLRVLEQGEETVRQARVLYEHLELKNIELEKRLNEAVDDVERVIQAAAARRRAP